MAQHFDEPASALPDDNADEQFPTLELESLPNRLPSRHKRFVQLGLLLVGSVVFLATFWSLLLPGGLTVLAPKLQPTNAPDTLLISSDVNYGTVTVNGQKQQGALPLLVEIHGDVYDIRLDAPPFFPRSCQIHFSSAQAGPLNQGACQVSPTNHQLMTIKGQLVSPGFLITIVLALNDLPANQQHQITTLVTQGISTQHDLVVPPGSYFATSLTPSGQITSQRATTPLQASAIVAPTPSSSQDSTRSCVGLICAGGFDLEMAPLADHLWSLAVFVALHWRFRQASGAVVGEVAFPAGGTVSFFLTYHAALGWSLSFEGGLASPVDNDIYCATGMGILGQQVINTTGSTDMGTSHDQDVQGCEILLLVNNADQGTYLWRFGVLMAADVKARAFLPELPVAPLEELAAIGG
jgi:hypothetical protein